MDEEKNKLMIVKENKNKMINYITVLNILSAIAVVILHSKFNIRNFSREQYWQNANIIESIFHFAVPVFFMISGITLIDYRDRYDTKTFFEKRIKKTVIPFIFWSVIGMLYFSFVRKYFEISDFTITQFFNAIIETKYMFVYWFFPALFSVYLSMPLFSAIEKRLRKDVFISLLIVCAIFNFILPFINKVFEQDLILPITVQVGSGYLIYIIIGYLLHTTKIDKVTQICIYTLGLMGLFLQIFGTYGLSMEENKYISLYKGYTNVPCILYSTAIFLLVKNVCSKIENKTFFSIINKIKKYTFATYLMHWYFIDLITIIFDFDTKSMLYAFGMPVIVIPLCIFVTYILRKIPIIRHIVPE